MKHCLFPLACAFAFASLSAGCESGNGDPHSGGIFWSESKAKQRLANADDDRRAQEDQTAQSRGRARDLEVKIKHLRAELARKREEARQFDLQGKTAERDAADADARATQDQLDRREAELARVEDRNR